MSNDADLDVTVHVHSDFTFTLFADEVPEPPTSSLIGDRLRWLLTVMNPDDRAFAFIAGVFAYFLARGCVSGRQASRFQKIYARVTHAHACGSLHSQQATQCYARRPGGGR